MIDDKAAWLHLHRERWKDGRRKTETKSAKENKIISIDPSFIVVFILIYHDHKSNAFVSRVGDQRDPSIVQTPAPGYTH